MHIGFKYIGNVALQLEKSSRTVIFGYEEAIGFMLGSKIRDKDGVAATVRLYYTESWSNFEFCCSLILDVLCGDGGSPSP